MKFRMVHNNFNVLDLDKSLKFYRDAFDMHEVRRINAKDGSFIIVYLEDGSSAQQLELKRRMRSTKRWAVSVLKTKIWAFISARTPTITGSKSFRKRKAEAGQWTTFHKFLKRRKNFPH